MPVHRNEIILALTVHTKDSFLYLKSTGKPTKDFKQRNYLITLAAAWEMSGVGVVRERKGVTWK